MDAGLATYAQVADVPAWRTRGIDYGDLCRPQMLHVKALKRNFKIFFSIFDFTFLDVG